MTSQTSELDEEVDEQEEGDRAFIALIDRLNRQSVEKYSDPYVDIDWDAPAMALDPDDERVSLWHGDPLAVSAWFRSQPPDVQARVAIWRFVSAAKVGVQFENLLKQGFLHFTLGLPNGAAEFRYCYHEIIEETRHSMMFQEAVNRSGVPVEGMPWLVRTISRVGPVFGWVFPEFFFFLVLAGEDPIDHLQRQTLRHSKALHPLAERIMRIHVTEEARHLTFARHFLKLRVPRLGWGRRHALSIAVPVALSVISLAMTVPEPKLWREFSIPPHSVVHAFGFSPEGRTLHRDAVRKPRQLAVQLGLVNRLTKPLWQALHIWDEPSSMGA